MTTAYEVFRNASGLGQQTKAASAPVVLASDSDGLPITDSGGSLTVDSPQLPAALGQAAHAGSISVVQSRTATDNTTYIANGDMSADVTGPDITVAAGGRLLAEITWSSTGTPVGTLSLQGKMPSGAYQDINGASAEFVTQPNNNTGALLCTWRELQIFSIVRIKYTRTSGGAANTSLAVKTRTV